MKMIEIIGGLLIMVILIPVLGNLMAQGFALTQQRQAADHLGVVSRAASGYVRKHQTDLLTQATASSGPSVTVATMVSEGLLPTGFRDHNVWGQSYLVYVRKDATSGDLRAVVLTTGGRGHTSGSNFGTSIVPGAAALLGGSAGFVPSGDIPGQSAGSLQGSGGGWNLPLASLGISSPGAGHLGVLTNFDSSALGQDYLYRVAVPGHDELNAMETTLDMSNHGVKNVAQLQFVEREITSEGCSTTDEQGQIFLDKTRGLYICRNNSLEIIGDSGNSTLVRNILLAKDGDVIEKPTCAPHTNTVATIFTSPSIAEVGPEAPPLSSFQTWATSTDDTHWQVHMRLLTPKKSLSEDGSGWVYPAADFHRISVLTSCSKTTSVTP